jgi:hypothetical protein
VAEYDRAIPPGGVGKITLQISTKGYMGKTRKSATVYSNDPNQQTATIYLSINIRPHIIVEPRSRIFLSGIEGEDIRRVVNIRAANDQPLEITGIETNLDSVIDYKLNRKADGRQHELEVGVKSAGKQITSGFLQLSTNHPIKKKLRLRVLVRITPELEVRPARMTFREKSQVNKPSRHYKRVFTVVHNRGKPFRVRDLQYNEEYFEVRPLKPTDKESSKHLFEVVVLIERLPAGSGGLKDTLIIETDLPQAEELKVPIEIQIAPPRSDRVNENLPPAQPTSSPLQ